MKKLDAATRLRRALHVVHTTHELTEPDRVVRNHHTLKHGERIRTINNVILDTRSQPIVHASSIMLIMNEEDALALITELENDKS